jgi:hypothetical protein
MMKQSRDALNPIMADGQRPAMMWRWRKKGRCEQRPFPLCHEIELPGLELEARSKHEPALLLLREEQLDRRTAILADTLLGDVDGLQ